MPTAVDTALGLPFTNAALTEAANLIPNTYGLVRELDLMPAEPIASSIVQLDSVEGVIHALPSQPVGAPAIATTGDTARARYIGLAHVPGKDTILARDLQNMLQAGTRNPQTLESAIARRLETYIRPRHDITREVMRMAALKGLVIDGAGDTLLNLYTEFGVAKTTVFFDLSNAASDVIGKCSQVYQHIGTNLLGSPMSGIEAIVSAQFFNAFIQHPKVKDTWLAYEAASRIANMTRQGQRANYGRTFEFQNILFREYLGQAPLWDRATSGPATGATAFVQAGYGHAYPTGTINVGVTFDGPPNDIDMVNQAPPSGDYVHVVQERMKYGAGVELVAQSNLMPIWRQPRVLVELRDSAS